MNRIIKKIILTAPAILIAVLFSANASAQAGAIDPTFNSGAFFEQSRRILAIERQPDGKILIGGDFETTNGALKTSIARLNTDGTIDDSFNSPEIVGTIRSIALQPDGKILFGGFFVIPLLTNNTLVARLNADGSFDNTFATMNVGISPNPANSVSDVEVTPDGKVVFAGNFSITGRQKFARVNPDGTLDQSFNPPGVFTDITDIEIQADGKIVGVTTSGGNGRFVKRFNADGSEDPTFNALITGSQLYAVEIQPDGKILIGGDFTAVNNIARIDAARLNTDGTLDTTFNITTDGFVYEIEVETDGRILIGGAFLTFNGVTKRSLVRVDANGNLDNSFPNFLTSSEVVRVILPLPDGKILVSVNMSSGDRVIRLNPNGSLDDSFRILVGVRGTVTDIIVQPDGKFIAAGDFSATSSFSRRSIARFNADGSLDAAFNPPLVGTSNSLPSVRALALQPDGKILVGARSNGAAFVRLNVDGSIDASFNAALAGLGVQVFDIAVQLDGKIIAAGSFNSVAFTRRFNADGSLDNSFNTVYASAGGVSSVAVNRVVIQPDGKVLVGGEFVNVNGSPRGRVARLNADGSLDATFNPLGGADNTVFDLALQTDGKIVIGGSFTSYNGSGRNSIARLNADGNLDASFTGATNFSVRAIRIEPGGKIIIGGDFTTVNGAPRNKIARLTATGTNDATFNVGTGITASGSPNAGAVFALALQPDNKIVVGGTFTKYNDIGRVSIVRLLNNSATVRTRFDFDGDGRADVAVFRPSNGNWYQLRSSNNAFNAVTFGQSGDQIAPADYDGDGKTDIAVFRGVVAGAGNFAYFYILNSSDNSFRFEQFGATGDVPVSGDWDGDGKADLAVYREGAAGGQSNFYYRPSSDATVNFRQIAWGGAGDKPLVGDFDGDGRLDAAVFRPSTAAWYILQSSNNQVIATNFGVSTDIPVPADYDGNGKANIAVFRPSTGTWFTSTNAANNYGAVQFGANGDLPVPADYDGDGRADVAVFRPSNGAWYLLRTTQGFTGVAFGDANDKPIPNAFVR